MGVRRRQRTARLCHVGGPPDGAPAGLPRHHRRAAGPSAPTAPPHGCPRRRNIPATSSLCSTCEMSFTKSLWSKLTTHLALVACADLLSVNCLQTVCGCLDSNRNLISFVPCLYDHKKVHFKLRDGLEGLHTGISSDISSQISRISEGLHTGISSDISSKISRISEGLHTGISSDISSQISRISFRGRTGTRNFVSISSKTRTMPRRHKFEFRSNRLRLFRAAGPLPFSIGWKWREMKFVAGRSAAGALDIERQRRHPAL